MNVVYFPPQVGSLMQHQETGSGTGIIIRGLGQPPVKLSDTFYADQYITGRKDRLTYVFYYPCNNNGSRVADTDTFPHRIILSEHFVGKSFGDNGVVTIL